MEIIITILLASILYILWKIYFQHEDNRSLQTKQRNDGGQIIWNDHPGCFERHLQRRHNNLLFRKSRQKVTEKELSSAKSSDNELHKEFMMKYTLFMQMYQSHADSNSNETVSLLQDLGELISLAYTIGGDLKKELIVLKELEAELQKELPEDAQSHINKLNELHPIERLPFLLQSAMTNTPILKNEIAESLLCEDIDTIRLLGSIASAQGENFHPNLDDIKLVAVKAIERGADAEFMKKLVETFNKLTK